MSDDKAGGERCPDCGRPFATKLKDVGGNGACGKDLPRTECNNQDWIDAECAEWTVDRLRAELEAARKVIEAARCWAKTQTPAASGKKWQAYQAALATFESLTGNPQARTGETGGDDGAER